MANGYTIIKNDNSYIKNATYNGKLNIDQIIKFNVDELKKISFNEYEYVGETIEKISSRLIAKYKFDISKKNFYAYIMREMMRNVVEHSEAKEFYLKIYLDEKKEIGFRVIDNGIGIMKSLNSNPQYNVADHMTALAFSIRPGITKTYKKDLTIDDIWQNSGFGLYMISSIGSKLGWFSIKSGNYCLSLWKSIKEYDKDKIKGCEVTIVLRNNIKLNTSELLAKISKEGNDIANNSIDFSKYAEIKTASKASTLLQKE